MKTKNTRSIVLISVLIAVFAINFGFVFSTLNSNSHTQQITLIDDLRTSTEYNVTIVIDDTNPAQDWATRKAEGLCTGSGTAVDPYIISGHVFNSFLNIKNSRKHFRVQNCEFTDTVYGMWILNISNGIIEDNHVTNALFGFDIMNCSHIEFRNNNCSLTGNTGILAQFSNDLSFYSNILSKKTSDGIRLNTLENSILEGNTLNDNNRYGIMIVDSESLTITANTAALNLMGVYVADSDFCLISGNSVNESDAHGIYVSSSDNNTIEDNTVQYSVLSGVFLDNSEDTLIYKNSLSHNNENGIELTSSDNITILDNEAFNNTENGINVFSSDENRLETNDLHQNGENGIQLISGSQQNILTGNIASFNNLSGIALELNSHNNLIYDNIASNNKHHGFYISGSNNNFITLNFANDNTLNGIQLLLSDRNRITSNTVHNNVNGTNLVSSDDNVIFGNNLANNIYCYNETNSFDNIYENNICQSPATPSLPLDPFILGLIIGLVVGFGALAAVLILNSLRGRKK